MVNKTDLVELGLACADVLQALYRGIKGRREDELSGSLREAIERLTGWVLPAMDNVHGPLTTL